MATKTIPDLAELTSADDETLFLVDSGVQSFKLKMQNTKLIQQTAGASITVPSGKTLMWSQMAIGNGKTVTVPSGARLANEGAIIVSGTGVLVATGTGVIRAF